VAIPDFQSLMLPILRLLAGATAEVPVREVIDRLGRELKLSEAELREQLPSGRGLQFYNRAQWACTHMRKAAIIESPRRAYLRITPRGRDLLGGNPQRVDLRLLATFPEYKAFRAKRAEPDDGVSTEAGGAGATRTPLEVLESGYQALRSDLISDLLDRSKACSPAFFERLVVELLVRMGYGGSLADAGKALGRSGDGGIDGIIKEDRLGLDFIFVQAKRWADKPVGRPEVQQFQGALAGHGAGKGVFLTTSHFTKDALDYAAGLRNSKIVLIDGDQLAELMIDFGIGVATSVTYEVKRVDSDYFEEGEA
jgi:restriction system protein